MTVSVIIATRNRATLLDECLTHLARQQFAPGDEVIVVDNGSADRTASVLALHESDYPVPLRVLEEPTPGKSHALGRALAVATGDVLAFTDDDVNVDVQWITSIKAAMTNDAVALVGGPVAPRWERPAPSWLRLGASGYGRLAAPLALVDYGSDAVPLGSRTALGANLAVRRDVIARVGGFARHLGKLHGTLLSGEDHDLCQRVQAAGLQAIYWPDARVEHWVPIARLRIRYFLAWFFWSGITHAKLERGAPPQASRTLCGVPLYLVKRFVSGIVGALAAIARLRLHAAVDRASEAAFAAGYAAAQWRLVAIEQPRRVAHPV
jgi:glycosyltransferase involved in cell wall biosynthesis